MTKNHLSNETSPYLLQHANNPVHWYAWNDEALARAKKENKPIFLSIGYSACHWCHVMAHESFENEDVAQFMNENYVNIKVDREERPDIDDIYQKVCQIATGQGGWPLSIFLTPDQKPFYVGTYFPVLDSYGRPGFGSILRQLSQAWKEKPSDIEKSANNFLDALKKTETLQTPAKLEKILLDEA
ncbi:MAG: thioredoxin domain-containing protein, partial [Candidatus Nitrosomaritimum yanchengensis]